MCLKIAIGNGILTSLLKRKVSLYGGAVLSLVMEGFGLVGPPVGSFLLHKKRRTRNRGTVALSPSKREKTE